jgi:DNA-binding response OmpR family regulator
MDALIDTTPPNTRFGLIVDDDLAFREVAARTFRRLSLGILEAPTLRKAGDLIGQRRQDIDLLVVDGMLPDGNGLEFVEMLRANDVNVPIVYVSAFAREDDALKGRLLGPLRVCSVLSKPVGVVNLLRAVEAAIQATVSKAPVKLSDEAGMRDMQGVYVQRNALDLWILMRAVRRMAGPATSSVIAQDSLAIAHRLHGSAATYGFVALSNAARDVERALSSVVEEKTPVGDIRWGPLATSLEAAAAELGPFEPNRPPGESWSGASKTR